ncbi:hypothetical protein B0H14DRAFT_3490148 [Mycena olivaceomarginata]|nr:hypothetical protein B0H14DRAFT_3490148 [Mycena olivaceomarginata]
MVWVDKPLNQAKSNVVNQDVHANINKIADFRPEGASFNLIQDLEYFIRNLATLGTYFGNTAATFQATALRVQNRLSHATPDTPDVNLPVEFNSWLRNLMSTYPNGCTSRANAAYQAYHTKMTAIANQVNNGVVPPCFPLYAAGRLLFKLYPTGRPLYLRHQTCLPVTSNIQFGINPNGTPEPSISLHRTLGSDNPDFYAIGDGTDFSGDNFIADDISTQYANCQGAWDVGLSA